MLGSYKAARQVQSTSLLANFDPATALVNPDPLTAATPVPNANANANNNVVENANVAAPVCTQSPHPYISLLSLYSLQ